MTRARACRVCRARFTLAPTGRPRAFCSDRCRQKAHRRRGKTRVEHRSQSEEWATPNTLFGKLDARWRFTLDVCATPDNAKCPEFYAKADDGLRQPWTGRVWCNPPYGRNTTGRWVERARRAVTSGEAEVVVMLLPARTDTRWWHEHVAHGEVEFCQGRLKFGGSPNAAPFPSALVVFRNAAIVTKP